MNRLAALGLAFTLAACKGTPSQTRGQGDAGNARGAAPEGGVPNALAALPYLQVRPVSSADRDKSGLQLQDYERSDRSFRLHVDGPSEAVLLDPKGSVVWTWKLPAPARPLTPGLILGWGYAGLLESGDLLVVDSFERVMKLAPDSKILWESKLAAHHNAVVASNGDIYVPTATIRMIDIGKEKRAIIDDEITVLDASGKTKARVSEWDAFLRHPELGPRLRAELQRLVTEHGDDAWAMTWEERSHTVAAILAAGGPTAQHDAHEKLRSSPPIARLMTDGGIQAQLAAPWVGSFFHTNKVVPLERDVPGLGKKGEVLVSNFVLTPLEVVRGLFVFDLAKRELKGRVLEGVLDGQHEPTILENGNVLVFDNRVSAPGSRVVEVNPSTRDVVWSYEAPDFRVQSEGAVFPLPNGDVLVTDSQRGRVFEVTRDKAIVWDYFRPVTARGPNPMGGLVRGSLHAVTPVPAALAKKLLTNAGAVKR